MEPRDIFDGLLVAVLGILLYVRIVGPSVSTERLNAVVAVVLNLDVVVYVVVAGVLGVVFIGYIAVYLPRKQSQV